MHLLSDVANRLAEGLEPYGPQQKRKIPVLPEREPQKMSLAELCNRLHEIFRQDKVCIDELREAMELYDHKRNEWKKYLYFDAKKYTRNLVDAGNHRFNVIVLAWSEDQGSAIHDHAGSHCVMKILDGTLRETQYEWPTEEDKKHMKPLKIKQIKDYQTGAVAYIHGMSCSIPSIPIIQRLEKAEFAIHDKIGLHRVENKSLWRKAVSLHVYCPPIVECERFDERTSKPSHIANMTFFSVGGQKLPLSEPARKYTS